MANNSGHSRFTESDEHELARCRRLQIDLRALVELSQATIRRSKELRTTSHSPEIRDLVAVNSTTRQTLAR